MADQRRPGHPPWCSQGSECSSPRTARDGTVEWSHWIAFPVEGGDRAGYVWLVRMESLTPDGQHHVEASAQVTADGPFDADQLEGFASALLHAARALRAGLPGTPNDLAVALAQREERR
jgi:hypothetical protein